MSFSTLTQPVSPYSNLSVPSSLPAEFLNAYDILNADTLQWTVALYKVEHTENGAQVHQKRGDIRQVLWKLRDRHKSACRGYGFVVDINEDTVAIPSSWAIPSPITVDGYTVTRKDIVTARFGTLEHRDIVTGILREGLKKHFKDHRSSKELGDIWQEFNDFCQTPSEMEGEDYSFCRKFRPSVKVLRGHRWVIECVTSTITVDTRSFSDYYQTGNVAELAQMISIKQANKVDRQNQPVGVRILCYDKNAFCAAIDALELDDIDKILQHAYLTAEQQQALPTSNVLCHAFKKPPEEVPLDQLYLILDSGITGENHSETIINPVEREELMRRLRDFMHGADIYGQKLLLADLPFDVAQLPGGCITPPATRVRGEKGSQTIIPAPPELSEGILKERTRDRSQHVRKYGFLEQRPVNLLLAFPDGLGEPSERRMRNDLNHILRDKGIRFEFRSHRFGSVDDIRREIERGHYDALFAVLPDNNDEMQTSVHDQIKQRIDVPSQCIRYANTLDRRLVEIPYREFPEKKKRYGRRVQQMYDLCIANLLVKHNWVPFAPAEPFHFNVHIGLDVGGVHNTDAVSCFGYGFRNPLDDLLFRPDGIPIETRKAEPIPTKSLYEGLLRQFEFIASELKQVGRTPDFEKVLFIRDGQLLGADNAWNEKDAFGGLHAELLRRQWITPSSIWTAVEVMKAAADWRLFRGGDLARNPLAGRYLFPFDDDDLALVCTTGSQYLTQGTACPLLARIVDIHGKTNRNEVIRDLMWEAAMCFTKPDVGMSLPWVLHVADAGALQQSRSYMITGITT
jgi:hypothetical protein